MARNARVVDDDYLGSFLSLAELERRYPAADRAGLTASVEFVSGRHAQVVSDGSAWLAVARVDPVTGTVVAPDGSPVGGSVITQPVRTGNFTLVASDSGTVIPVTGAVTVTINAASDLTAAVEIKRYDAATLGVVASGVALIDPATGTAWGTLQIANKLSSIIVVLGSTADEYAAKKFGA